ncbi:hypothetical protein RUND412_002318 [Rhizina undulata]
MTTSPPPQQPPFTPFFTLISNPSSTSYTHPIVHYVFADDDFDPYLAAETFSASSNPRPQSRPQSQSKSSQQQLTQDGKPKERIIIVDVNPDCCSVSAARSLAPDWQVSGVSISAAPQWMATSEGSGEGGGGGLMLTIEGTEMGFPKKAATEESVFELAEMFTERMALLKRITEFGRLSVPSGEGGAAGDELQQVQEQSLPAANQG